ncbi:MAG: SGNH/GDSL hydrolase family protein [Eudoraea sp.]|uniref:SGNH/GDSL hydrolase family protein n=1 Tax=Eudoraea sp. TaxID=1979955 RepID=UPI003C736A0F
MTLNKINILLVVVLFFMYSLLSAQDWAQLAHFEKANNELSMPANNEDRVVFMGNSITIGWSNHQPQFFKDKPYVNRGISGQTTPQMLVRFRQDVIDLKPKVVVILAGTNDIAGNTGPSTLQMIADNVMSMAELADANGIKVVLCSVLPAYDYPWRKGLMPNEKIPALNKIIKSYAGSKDFVYLDYFTAMTDGKNGLKEDLGSDGVHPNKKGYELMAPLAEKAIAKALNKS